MEQLPLRLLNLTFWYLSVLKQAPSSTLNTLPILPSFILINSYPFFLRQHIILFELPSQCTKRWVCWITEIYFSHFWKLEVEDQGVSIPLEDYEEESVPSPCLGFGCFLAIFVGPWLAETRFSPTSSHDIFLVCMSVSKFPFVQGHQAFWIRTQSNGPIFTE